MAELNAGRLKPGEALRPEVQLAEEFGISRQTLRRGLAALNEQGVIRREHGRGTFITEDVHRRLRPEVNSFALMVLHMLPSALPLLNGFQQACSASQGQAILCDTGNNLDTQAGIIMRMLFGDAHVSGVAMLPPSMPPTPSYHVTALQKRGIPVVFCHRGVKGARAPMLALPYEEMGRLAGRAMVRNGHRRVGMFCSYQSLLMDVQIRGLRETMQSSGGELPKEFVYEGRTGSLAPEVQEKEVEEAMRRMLDTENRPTAIWVISLQDAELIHEVMQRRGLRVPEDISLITTTVDDNPIQPFLRNVSAVTVPDTEIGRRAVGILQEIQSGQRPINDDEQIIIPVGWKDGRTLGPAP